MIHTQTRKNAFTRHQKVKHIFLFCHNFKTYVQKWVSITLNTSMYNKPRANYNRRKVLHTPSIIYSRGFLILCKKKHLWVGRSKGATPAGGRRAIKGAAHSNIRVAGWVGRSKAVTPAGGRRAILYATHSNISVAGIPPPDFGEAVVSSRYSNDISSICLSESLFTPSSQVLMVGRPAEGQAGKRLPNKGRSRSRALG